ncbi:MAG: helix-turn-helix transcriptional regulator [Proteobacteria bacterium]|nr:helix-turn-helix transcriptional regulator [Pseudomonadota bacterium]
MNQIQFRTGSPPGGVPTTVGGCPLRTAVGAIGGRWKPLVLHYLLQRPHGFGELRRACDNVANKTLATQLRELERDGLISRTVNADARRSVCYAPTEDGMAMQPVIRALVAWGNRRLEQAEQARAALVVG